MTRCNFLVLPYPPFESKPKPIMVLFKGVKELGEFRIGFGFDLNRNPSYPSFDLNRNRNQTEIKLRG
jgi:hypothetical protein